MPDDLNDLLFVPIRRVVGLHDRPGANLHQQIIKISFVVIPAVLGEHDLLESIRRRDDLDVRRVNLQNKLVSVLTENVQLVEKMNFQSQVLTGNENRLRKNVQKEQEK